MTPLALPVLRPAPAATTVAAPSAAFSDVPLDPYSPGSFWNTPLPADTPLSSNSAGLVQELSTEVTSNWGGHVAFNTANWAPSVYTVGAGQPTVSVAYSNCQNKSWVDPSFVSQMAAVPIPAGAVPGGGGDAEMAVYQPSTGTEWDLWHAQDVNGSWSACWGGMLTGVQTSTGVFPDPYGATGTGLGLMGGIVTPSDLQSGAIHHAIAVSVINTAAGQFSWPANRGDGWSTAANAIPEGLRFRLDPSINVDSLHLTPLATMVAKAMQTYGIVIRDTAGSVALYGEDPAPFVSAGGVNPYTAYLGSGPAYTALDGIPWASMEALPFDYGQPAAPVPPQVPAAADLTLSSPSVQFGTVPTSSYNTATITVTNSGTAPGSLQAPVVAGSPAFDAGPDTCGTDLAPGASCSVTVNFSPAAAGTVSGSVAVGSLSAALSGTGVGPSSLGLSAWRQVWSTGPGVTVTTTQSAATFHLNSVGWTGFTSKGTPLDGLAGGDLVTYVVDNTTGSPVSVSPLAQYWSGTPYVPSRVLAPGENAVTWSVPRATGGIESVGLNVANPKGLVGQLVLTSVTFAAG